MHKADAKDSIAIKNIALTRDLIGAMNEHNWEKMASFYVDSPMMMTASGGTAFKKSSHKEMIEEHTGLANMIKDLRFDITSIMADSNRVAYEFTASGIANGKPMLMPLSCFITIEKNKIIRDATYFDQ